MFSSVINCLKKASLFLFLKLKAKSLVSAQIPFHPIDARTKVLFCKPLSQPISKNTPLPILSLFTISRVIPSSSH